MTDHIEDGGPAFPTENAHQSSGTTWHHEGMTLRNYFAAKVLPAVYRDFWDGVRANLYAPTEDWRGDIARDAYLVADAMLKARKS